MPVNAVFLAVIAGVAVLMDMRSACVDNAWILFSLCTGAVLRITQEGAAGIRSFAGGITLPVLLLAALFYFRMLGPGDVKLFSALGGIMGARDILYCMAVSFGIGAVISLAILLSCGGIACRLHYLFSYFQAYMRTGRAEPYSKKGMTFENFHFTVPVFLSVLLYAGGVY